MIVAQARMPSFYRDYAVADTVNGRFDLIVLHLALLYHRLAVEPVEHRKLGQAVFDRFCQDMDHNLREMGVGDLAVPKKMQRIGAAFYGCLRAYEVAFAAGNDHALAEAITRNVENAATAATPVAVSRLVAYMTEAVRLLSGQRYDTLAQGEIGFPDPEKIHEKEYIKR